MTVSRVAWHVKAFGDFLQKRISGNLRGRNVTLGDKDDANCVTRRLRLGWSTVRLVMTQQGTGGATYVSLHEDEQTAVRAAERLLRDCDGRLIELRSRKGRIVSFWLGFRRYAFDPNRIFTDAGIEPTLRRHGPYSPGARSVIAGLRDEILALLFKQGQLPIVALHNAGSTSYSIDQYLVGGLYAEDAAYVSRHVDKASNDFFIVTRRDLFDALSEGGFNVVLQAQFPIDDGSLSVFCQREHLTYVNVEAHHRHLGEQWHMLQFVSRLLACVSESSRKEHPADRQEE